jgi:hypothetical protein
MLSRLPARSSASPSPRVGIVHATQWPMGAPPEKPGFVSLPTGREVYWTGQVAIGLRHTPAPDYDKAVPHSTLWVQELLLEAR